MALSIEQWNAPSGDADFYEHQIANSLRLDRATAAHLSLAANLTSDNEDYWTLSWWWKSTAIATDQTILSAGSDNGVSDNHLDLRLRTNSDNTIRCSSTEANIFTTTSMYRDPSAWNHGCWSNNNGASILYVNGVQVANGSLDGGAGSAINKKNMAIGKSSRASSQYFEGYLAEMIMISHSDNAAVLTPTSFTETKNGVLIPKDVSGLSNKDFYLKFEDSSALGNDSSGNDRDWTVNNIAATDQMLDSPTFGSSNGGNFASWNVLSRTNPALQYGTSIYSEGNLRFAGGTTGSVSTATTLQMQSGKWYVELCPIGAPTSGWPCAGLVFTDKIGVAQSTSNIQPTNAFTSWVDLSSGNIYDFAGNSSASYGASLGNVDILNIAVDVDAGKVWWGKNGTYFDSGNPAGGSGEGDTFTAGRDVSFHAGIYDGAGKIAINAGQDGSFAGAKTAQGNADGNGYGNFFYAPPSGFLALCTANLPVADEVDPAQTDDDFPQKLFNTLLYTGTGNELAVTGLGFKPDWQWLKNRPGQNDFQLTDSTRGVTKALESNVGQGQTTQAQGLKVFGNDGFTVGTDDAYNSVNEAVVTWNWRLNGGTTSANSVGGTASVTQVDPSGAVSIVTYTTDISGSSGTGTIGHGMSVAPELILHHSLAAEGGWWSQNKSTTNANYFLELNGTRAQTELAAGTYGAMSRPTASVFSINGVDGVGGEGRAYIAYCFASIDGYCKVDSYEGLGAADGVFVYTGFSPAWIMTKSLDSTSDWQIFDNKRLGYNVDNNELRANVAGAETTTDMIDIVSNGFKCRIATDPNVAETYIYLAFANNPLKYATAR